MGHKQEMTNEQQLEWDSLQYKRKLEANKAIDECVMKTGLTREQVILYVSGKVDRYKLLMSWCNDC